MDACAREPIHIPGSIQPHGALLVIDPASRRIVQASDNAAQALGVQPDAVLGRHYGELMTLTGPAPAPLQDAPSDYLPHAPVHFLHRPLPPQQEWVVAWHRYPRCWISELEPAAGPLLQVSMQDAVAVLRQLEKDTTIAQASQRAAREIRALLGYDRVMVYRFDEAWNGDVIAEARAGTLEAYLGLHYPASDIPAQARALYLRNRVRQIADVGYTPSPIEPALDPATGAPVDLSDVSLRSVSPIHLEYLANMGVAATLVTSIVVNDALWGLIACHHYQPHHASHVMRDVADAISRGLGARIGGLVAIEHARLESTLQTVREKLITSFNEADTMTQDMLAEMAPDLLDVVDADGVAIFHHGQMIGYGIVPPADDLARIRDAIESGDHAVLREGVVGALHSDCIGEDFPSLADLAPLAAGLIFVPLVRQSRSALLWTRREQVQTVNWAGNPGLSKLQDIPGARLSPRKSFELWRETVQGRARPWLPQHLESARSLRVLIELMERKRYQQDLGLLESSLARLRQGVAIVERIGEPPRSRIAFANDAFAHICDMDISEIIGLELQQWFDPTRDPQAMAQLEAHLQRGEAGAIALPLTGQPGDGMWTLHFEPLPGRSDAKTHWLVQLQAP